jgi:hypothetical protein
MAYEIVSSEVFDFYVRPEHMSMKGFVCMFCEIIAEM